MARKIFNEIVSEHDLFVEYLDKKAQYDSLKKEVESLGNKVKQQMTENKQNSVEKNGFKITKSVSQRINWKEDVLLQKVKTFDIPELVKTVEQVDVDALQQSIINEKVSIEDLKDCQEVKEVVQLRISKVKESENE